MVRLLLFAALLTGKDEHLE